MVYLMSDPVDHQKLEHVEHPLYPQAHGTCAELLSRQISLPEISTARHGLLSLRPPAKQSWARKMTSSFEVNASKALNGIAVVLHDAVMLLVSCGDDGDGRNEYLEAAESVPSCLPFEIKCSSIELKFVHVQTLPVRLYVSDSSLEGRTAQPVASVGTVASIDRILD